jgi:hypothetical protein
MMRQRANASMAMSKFKFSIPSNKKDLFIYCCFVSVSDCWPLITREKCWKCENRRDWGVQSPRKRTKMNHIVQKSETREHNKIQDGVASGCVLQLWIRWVGGKWFGVDWNEIPVNYPSENRRLENQSNYEWATNVISGDARRNFPSDCIFFSPWMGKFDENISQRYEIVKRRKTIQK